MDLKHIDIVLVEPVYPGNVGAMARSASNFGVESIKIVGNLDYLCLEAKKMALYGYPLLESAHRFQTLTEAIADDHFVIGTVHQDRFNRSTPRPLWDVFDCNREKLLTGRTAVVFGREDNGLTREEIDLCNALAIIPTPENMSFNLAHSVSVFLYEIYRQFHMESHVLKPAAPTHDEMENLIDVMHKALLSVGFFRGDHEVSSMIQLRELVYRMDMNRNDVPLFKAMLYKIYSFAARVLPHMPPESVRDCKLFPIGSKNQND